MYAFFYSLYISLFTGDWIIKTTQQATDESNLELVKWCNFVLNALGGNFTELQSLSTAFNIRNTFAMVCGIITIAGVCVVVWKLTKAVFSIFFSRA